MSSSWSCMGYSKDICVCDGIYIYMCVCNLCAFIQTGNGSAAVVMRRVATWCLKPKDRAELILCLLSRVGMPGTLRYK